MAVVLPVPAGARASWTARPLVAISRTRDCWAALSWSCVGGGFGDRDADADLADGAAAGAAGGLDDAPFGVDHGLGGVLAGAGEAVDADDLLTVAPVLGALQGSGDRHVVRRPRWSRG